ncbi:MAG: FtsH protease activity modulator HflK [Planctomycetota bacterium]
MTTPRLLKGRPVDLRPLRILLLAVPAVLLAWLMFSTYYTVPAESVGVVLRFGRYSSTAEPGLHFKLPFGIDSVQLVPVQRVLKLEFGFATRGATNEFQAGEDPEREKVTGDLNAALVEWVVQYRIGDPKEYLFHVREPAWTLRDLSEAVMREVIGDRSVDEVITIGRQEIEITVLARLRELVADYQLGIRIEQVQLKNVNPPREVQASFNEVNKAQQDKESAINVANGEYNKAVPRAQGEAAQKISEAEGYKLKRVNEALGDAAAFQAVLAQYVKAKEITRRRLYLETMAEILPGLRDKWIVDQSITQILPLMPGAFGGEGSR